MDAFDERFSLMRDFTTEAIEAFVSSARAWDAAN
jgi:hypothetical protein